MSDRPWKRQERQVAEMLGSRRNPNTGEHRADIDAGPFVVEHKARKSLPKWLTKALSQATGASRDGGKGQTPIVVLSEVKQGRKAERYVLMRFDNFLEWHGPFRDGGE